MKKTILLLTGILCLVNLGYAQQAFIDDAIQGTGLGQHNYVGAGWVHAGGIPAFYLNTLSYSAAAWRQCDINFFWEQI